MTKPKTLLSGILVASMLSGAVAHAQYSVLMLSDGREANVVFADWIETERPGEFTVDLSSDVDPTLVTTSDSINAGQMSTLNSYDLILVPRLGPGGTGNWNSKDWNLVSSPILTLNGWITDEANWGWAPQWSGNITEFRDLDVLDATSPIFDGVDIAEDAVNLFGWDATARALHPTSATPEVFTGQVIGQYTGTISEEPATRLSLIMWDGTESAFFDGGSEAPGGRRTVFAGPTQSPDQGIWTEAGQQLFFNVMEATIPEPGTYALLIGAGALGSVLILRRRRRTA